MSFYTMSFSKVGTLHGMNFLSNCRVIEQMNYEIKNRMQLINWVYSFMVSDCSAGAVVVSDIIVHFEHHYSAFTQLFISVNLLFLIFTINILWSVPVLVFSKYGIVNEA